MQVAVRDVFELFLVGGHALQPAERRHHGKQQMQFGVLGQPRLDEERRLRWIESRRQPVRDHFQGVLVQFTRVRVIGGQHVPVGHEVKALVVTLQLHPVLKCTDKVAEVKLPGGPHAAQDAREFLRSVSHSVGRGSLPEGFAGRSELFQPFDPALCRIVAAASVGHRSIGARETGSSAGQEPPGAGERPIANVCPSAIDIPRQKRYKHDSSLPIRWGGSGLIPWRVR